jgi:hypothetical protein
MAQLNLPLYNPQDRGRLNALRNILAAVSDELRRQAPVARGIVDFTVNELPQIFRQFTPFTIYPVDYNASPASPYPFEVFDLVQQPRDREVFITVAELVKKLDVPTLSEPLKDVELIGIDESLVDNPLPHSILTFLKSVAFRMYQLPDGTSAEAAGPIVSDLRMPLRESETAESEHKLLSYIRNNYIAYVSALTSLAFGRTPFVVMHGPLIRPIGGFSNITFDYQTALELFNINLEDAGEFDPPQGNTSPVVQGDSFTANNMTFVPKDALNGEKNLVRFNEFCLRTCNRQCSMVNVFSNENAIPKPVKKVTRDMIRQRDYPGFCLYFWMLRSLLDLSRLKKISIASVVENVSAATEMIRFVFPSLLAIPQARQRVDRSSLRAALQAIKVNYPSEEYLRSELYQQVKQTIEKLRLTDSNIFSYLLAEGQYTAPVQIYRYRTRNTFIRVLGDGAWGIDNNFETLLEKLFPVSPIEARPYSHPGYRVLMSYLRTTPLREPVRVEYFDLPHLNPAEKIIGPIYLLSLPYQEYGLPIILYYADKLARTPTQLVRTIIEREYLELVLQNRFSDPVSILSVLGRLTRGYFQREGLR